MIVAEGYFLAFHYISLKSSYYLAIFVSHFSTSHQKHMQKYILSQSWNNIYRDIGSLFSSFGSESCLIIKEDTKIFYFNISRDFAILLSKPFTHHWKCWPSPVWLWSSISIPLSLGEEGIMTEHLIGGLEHAGLELWNK